jgi:hypothetical protein
MTTKQQEPDDAFAISDDPPIPVLGPTDPADELLEDPAETARKNEYVPETFG